MKYFLSLLLLCATKYSFSQTLPAHLSASRILLEEGLAPFYHGVASGDPQADAVLLWTRVTPDSSLMGDVAVSWELAPDTSFTTILQSGATIASASKDYSVKVNVSGLTPATYYYYRFAALGKYSVIGRTKTLPTGNLDTLRLAVVSCAAFSVGYYNAYKEIALRNDVDAVIHLGDYIYEYGDLGVLAERNSDPNYEILNLADYRVRHSQHKLDPDLRYLHQQYPMICVWDDHEVANDAWLAGAQNHDPATEGNYAARKQAAVQAYMEWMPLLLPDANDSSRIYRKFQFGDLADLLMLDTRHLARDEQGGNVNDPNKSLLGPVQRQWLTSELTNSSTTWRMIGQQVMVAPLAVFSTAVSDDSWDGYTAERDYLLFLLKDSTQNTVVLTGDIHTSFGNDLPVSGYDASTGAGSAGVEFVAPSITTTSSPINVSLPLIQFFNPHIKYADLSRKGYIVLDINADRIQSDWFYVSSITSQNYTHDYGASLCMYSGTKFSQSCTGPSLASSIVNQTPAPLYQSTTGVEENYVSILGAYPNPTTAVLSLSFFQKNNEPVQLSLLNMEGKVVLKQKIRNQGAGTHTLSLDLQGIPTGNYSLLLSSQNQVLCKRIVKVD